MHVCISIDTILCRKLKKKSFLTGISAALLLCILNFKKNFVLVNVFLLFKQFSFYGCFVLCQAVESMVGQISFDMTRGSFHLDPSSLPQSLNTLCILMQVLDARDPQGTRCYHLEKHLKENCKHKHMVLLLNKVSNIIICSLTSFNCSKMLLNALNCYYVRQNNLNFIFLLSVWSSSCLGNKRMA